MKKITLTAVLFALCFATGFTCSKNAPQQTAQPVETAPAAQMAAPTTTTTQETMTTAPTAEGNGTTTTSTTTTTTPAAQPTTPEAHK